MKKSTTLALIAALGLATPAFAQTPADLHNDRMPIVEEPVVTTTPAPAKMDHSSMHKAASKKPAAAPAKKEAPKPAKKAVKKSAKKAAMKDAKKATDKDASKASQ